VDRREPAPEVLRLLYLRERTFEPASAASGTGRFVPTRSLGLAIPTDRNRCKAAVLSKRPRNSNDTLWQRSPNSAAAIWPDLLRSANVQPCRKGHGVLQHRTFVEGCPSPSRAHSHFGCQPSLNPLRRTGEQSEVAVRITRAPHFQEGPATGGGVRQVRPPPPSTMSTNSTNAFSIRVCRVCRHCR
jgi:hypothetical protein